MLLDSEIFLKINRCYQNPVNFHLPLKKKSQVSYNSPMVNEAMVAGSMSGEKVWVLGKSAHCRGGSELAGGQDTCPVGASQALTFTTPGDSGP
jgi:hypothetical protein